jgi:hypothetical protein
MTTRLHVIGLVLLGQYLGASCAAAFAVNASIRPQSLFMVTFCVLVSSGAIICSWLFIKKFSSRIRPFLVSVCSYLLGLIALSVWTWGEQRKLASSLSLFILVPIGSALGSYLASHIPPKEKKRPDNTPLNPTGAKGAPAG